MENREKWMKKTEIPPSHTSEKRSGCFMVHFLLGFLWCVNVTSKSLYDQDRSACASYAGFVKTEYDVLCVFPHR